jgi:DNA topoisomerase-1
MSNLIIVESAGKSKTISKILGKDYIVKVCFGHCRDLDPKSLSIDVNNNFQPQYSILKDKKKIVKDLIITANKCKNVILATDEDREGEMIASGLCDILKLDNPDRIVFHSITKDEVLKAINNPKKINEDMVYAQQARRLLDRLVGYKISPLLWTQLKGKLSAGRVQSVVVKIIIDKENEIKQFNDNNNESFYKTTGDFIINENIIKTTLMNKEIYILNDPIELLNKINKNSNFIIHKVTNKDIINKPSKPFITSTLQQEASTKYGYTPKKTMVIAQKLYEAGYITYMRTDSYNLSQDVINQCKKYIINIYGENYYKYRTFINKKGSQEAHEAIRPTLITRENIDMIDDYKKIYNLIWKRTIACQMEDSILNQNKININILNENQYILPKNVYFKGNIETIKFNGYLIVYEKENESNIIINKNDNIIMDNIYSKQDYNSPPLRYNQAGLIKYLAKNCIGRPATFASIIDKIMTREYVKNQNIPGIEKDSKQYKLNNKFKIKESNKTIFLGKENKKLVPTQIGIDTNQFMVKNFHNIIQLDFTANFEKLLDKIAKGKIKWYNVLDLYYKEFNPIVEKLSINAPKKKHNTDIYIGEYNDNKIYSMIGKYGLCVKMIINDDNKETFKYAKVKDLNQKDITLEIAIKLLEYPKMIGTSGKSEILLYKGPYGFYFQKGKTRVSIKDENRKEDIKYAIELFNIEPGAIKTFKIKNQKVFLKKGQYGYYLQYIIKGKKKNKSLPDNINIENLNIMDIIKI